MRARLVVFCGVAVSLLGQVAGNEDLYRLASKELVQPTGLKFEMNLKASLKDGLIKETWRGEGLFDGEMNALRSKKIHYHWAAVDQVDVEVMKSEFVGSVKAGERESPFEHQDDLQGKTFSFVQKAGVWSVAGGVKKPDAKLQKKKEDELFHFLQCFPVTASDQKLFGLKPRKIGEQWKMEGRLIPGILWGEVTAGEMTLTLSEIQQVNGEDCAVITIDFDLLGKVDPNAKRVETMELKGKMSIVRSLQSFMNLRVSGQFQLTKNGGTKHPDVAKEETGHCAVEMLLKELR